MEQESEGSRGMSSMDVEGYKKGVTVSIDVIESDSDGDNVWMFISWDDAVRLRDLLSEQIAIQSTSQSVRTFKYPVGDIVSCPK